jgi:hypothetical protein
MDDLKALQAVPAPLVALTGTKIRQLLDAPPDFIELLPLAAYSCDASGRVLWFNRRAVALWGREPRLGDDTELFCGSYKLHFD